MSVGAHAPSLPSVPMMFMTKLCRAVSKSGPTTHLDDGGLAGMRGGGRPVEHPVAVLGPLDVAQPARPVGVAHQVGVESDRNMDEQHPGRWVDVTIRMRS
ncbi:hypothetical protein EYF80_017583 [Liparis tanakae]|uniref:Uncharacterized protein n=1 Tax=Liparis tanakae TaxID=230148 RepID=A0A4Z2I3W6_9TELE|nr:hypothetical protein EYF80_017583 [Liparis tanakae]